jgi:hypothetical protein
MRTTIALAFVAAMLATEPTNGAPPPAIDPRYAAIHDFAAFAGKTIEPEQKYKGQPKVWFMTYYDALEQMVPTFAAGYDAATADALRVLDSNYDPANPDARCATPAARYAIRLAMDISADSATADLSAPRCTTQWLKQAAESMKDVHQLMRTSTLAGQRDALAQAEQRWSVAPTSVAAPSVASRPNAAQVVGEAIAAGARAFAAHPLGPQPGASTTCISNRVGQQTYTTCR